MDVLTKARVLSSASQYDSCGPQTCNVDLQKNLGGIINAKSEHKHCRMFKTLMTNACSHDCKYCTNRAGCEKQKVAYKPEELVTLFNFLRTKHKVNSLFLSSGVAKDADTTTEQMLETARLLRNKHKFRGYLHFKILPGTSFELVKQAAKVSDRLSINIEAPNKEVLNNLSSNKDFKNDLLKRQRWIKKMNLSSGQSTQMIVNNMATDKEILKTIKQEYDEMQLKRIYYSAFQPVTNTPLQNEKATPQWREHRLYNIDFLYRLYNFSYKELLSTMPDDMLTREDPKLVFAREHFRDGSLDINEASYEELLRVPGIGPVSAKRILQKKISNYQELKKIGVKVNAARPFTSINGNKQLSLTRFSQHT